MQQFENIRYHYFLNFCQIDNETIKRDIIRYMGSQKSLLEYFKDNNNLLDLKDDEQEKEEGE